MLGINLLFCGCALLIVKVMGKPPDSSLFDKFGQKEFKVKFEHMDIVHYNKSVFKELKLVTFKYNRTYTACNGSMELKIDLNNEVEVLVQTYKFASNEYRLFPLRLQMNGCAALSNNILGLEDITYCGNFSGCPLKKGIPVHVCNWSPVETRYPPLVPSGKYMLEIQVLYRSAEIVLLDGYAEIYRPIPIPD